MSLAFLHNCNPVWAIRKSPAHGKVCRRCHEGKPISQFSQNHKGADGYLNHCKQCRETLRKEALARG